MFKEDNSGFVNFPHPSSHFFHGRNVGKTMVYLIAFEPKNVDSELSHITLDLPGFYSDDVDNRPELDSDQDLDNLIESQRINDEYDRLYFPNISSEDDLFKNKSINLISSVCIGWSNLTYFHKNDRMWVCGFRDLTNEGQRMYYGFKKLHNNKEIRLLTFNHI